MADEKKSYPQFRTPRGPLVWPKLSEPDYGTKEYPVPEGQFVTKLVLKAADPATQKFLKDLAPIYQDAMAEAAKAFAALKPETRKKLKAVTENPLYTELLDKDTEQPTGEIEFKFSRKASYEAKKGPRAGQKVDVRLPLFDAFGELIEKAPEIWGGTIAKVSFTPSAYFIPGTGAAGLKLNLEAVQIIKLSQGARRSASDYGFTAEEDGYSYEDTASDAAEDETEDAKPDAKGTPDF